MVLPLRMKSMRPLVRYVDEDQAVIDAHFATTLAWSTVDQKNAPNIEVLIEIKGPDGFQDETRMPVELVGRTGHVKFDLVQPERWWPAGMGKQALYELSINLVINNEPVDRQTVTLGLTSVRHNTDAEKTDLPALLVNGQLCDIHSVVMVDQATEDQLLPATGDSLLLVRDHYGPEVLYDAADRAGILLVQCVPIHPEGQPEVEVPTQVERLVRHPSLAGWFVGHLGRLSDRIAGHISTLDPTRSVFRQIPVEIE